MKNLDLEKLYAAARDHIDDEYSGIFKTGECERHFHDYIQLEPSRQLLLSVMDDVPILQDQNLLDVGCGFGSFVFVSREAGFNAVGVDIADFEIQFARRRLEVLRTEPNLNTIYLQADARDLPFADQTFDLVTLFNVLEHVPSYREVLKEAVRVLCPRGYILLIAPNYLAFRQEAHYHVPWFPMLSKRIASAYLRLLRRDPQFLLTSIYYCTNWGVLLCFRQLGVTVQFPMARKMANPQTCRSKRGRMVASFAQKIKMKWLAVGLLKVLQYNPFKSSIYIVARKK